MATYTSTFTVRIDTDTLKAFDRIAEKAGTTRNALIAKLVADHVAAKSNNPNDI